jgi:predicted CXXCH cytochrome family protein
LEWNRSAHSQSLETLQAIGAQNFCLRCHSEDYRRDPSLTVQTAQFAIECVTCHSSHTTGVQGTSQLRKSQYALCTECHNGTNGGTRPITPGSEVHHPMQEMYEGRGMPGVEVNPSAHFLAADDGGGPVCSSCHFPETAKSGVITTWDGGMVKSGDISSHLLTPVLPGHAVAGEPTSCSACHSFPNNVGQSIIDQRQTATRGKLDVLEGWLAQLKAAGQTANEDYKYGITAHSFVASDGSDGFHNFPYATDILDTATDKVDGYRFLYLPTLLK